MRFSGYIRKHGLTKAAKFYKPDFADVLMSIAMDSGAIDEPFTDWVDNYGYDEDSIKAKAIYDACLQTAIKLRAGLGGADFEALRECEE